MSLLDRVFKNKPVTTYQDFWNWFQANQSVFYKIVKNGENPEKAFFDKLSRKLAELNDGVFYLTGMFDDHTVELIFTPDGIIKNITFVEDMVKAAPEIPNWKFTALKPALDIEALRIDMEGYTFDSESLSFYPVEHQDYPDYVDIVLVHNNYKEQDESILTGGTLIFLDNYLGEITSVTAIDNAAVTSREKAVGDLIPVTKLKDYLAWREQEFVEKYVGLGHSTQNDIYTLFEATLSNNKPVVARINTTVLEWAEKASHPWILKVQTNYERNSDDGMPNDRTQNLLSRLEDEIVVALTDIDGYLNIGRETADNSRNVYYACREFRKPSKLLHELTKKYSGELNVTYDIYKDKYWQSFKRFAQSLRNESI